MWLHWNQEPWLSLLPEWTLLAAAQLTFLWLSVWFELVAAVHC
jgi:hypothetical protein